MTKGRFIPDREIEEAALGVLSAYRRKYTRTGVMFPTPIEAILESLYGTEVEFHDTKEIWGVDGIIAALMVKSRSERVIYADTSLDPSVHPESWGRFRFTLAHELGHLVLHQDILENHLDNSPWLIPQEVRPSILCRSGSRDRIEIQADRFAACILMPRPAMMEYWHERMGDDCGRLDVSDEITGIKAEHPDWKFAPVCSVARDFASHFETSAEAMQLRMVALGLITLEPDKQLWLF